MITLQQVLSSQSNILENARVKLVRHQDSRQQYRDVIKDILHRWEVMTGKTAAKLGLIAGVIHEEG